MEVLQNPQAKNFKVFKSILERKTISIAFGEEMLMLKKLKAIVGKLDKHKDLMLKYLRCGKQILLYSKC